MRVQKVLGKFQCNVFSLALGECSRGYHKLNREKVMRNSKKTLLTQKYVLDKFKYSQISIYKDSGSIEHSSGISEGKPDMFAPVHSSIATALKKYLDQQEWIAIACRQLALNKLE